jgi:hypothetical protein
MYVPLATLLTQHTHTRSLIATLDATARLRDLTDAEERRWSALDAQLLHIRRQLRDGATALGCDPDALSEALS